MSETLTGLVAVLVPALLALGIPRVIASLPEPSPEREPDPDEPLDAARAADPPKEPWVDLAARPGLAWRCALASALVAALVWGGLGASWTVLPWMALVPAGVMLAVIDWRTRLLPTRLVWSSYAVVAALVVVASLAESEPGGIVRAGIGSLVSFATFFALWFVSPRSLGYGDVRLAALLGLALGHLGPGETVLGLYAGFLIGGVTGVALRLTGRLAPRQHIPFGPFMLVGAVLGLLWGGSLWESIYA